MSADKSRVSKVFSLNPRVGHKIAVHYLLTSIKFVFITSALMKTCNVESVVVSARPSLYIAGIHRLA